MDVRINNLTSNIHATDARAMLTPEVMDQIVKAVALHMKKMEREKAERNRDMNIDSSASKLD